MSKNELPISFNCLLKSLEKTLKLRKDVKTNLNKWRKVLALGWNDLILYRSPFFMN